MLQTDRALRRARRVVPAALLTAGLLTGGAILATSLTPFAAGAFVGMAAIGFLSIWLVASANTLVQLRSAPEMRGRVMGLWSMALPGTVPITGFLVSGVIAVLGARAGFACSGVAVLLSALLGWKALADRD